MSDQSPFLPRPATSEEPPKETHTGPMGISQSASKWLAVGSFVFDFALQQYGMNSSPNMKQVHDANLSYFSPWPWSIVGFFAPQQILQLVWLRKLFTKDATKEAHDYVPYYALGNICIGLWMFRWNASDFKTSNIFVVVNSLAQLYYVITQSPPWSDERNRLTHLVATTFAGIGVLDLLHNGSVAYANHQYSAPPLIVKVLTGVGFLGSATVASATMNVCLVWDLVGLAIGQSGQWRTLLGAYAVGTGAIAGYRHLVAS